MISRREALAVLLAPARPEGVEILNPRCRVPVSWIIDDSTCLVNLNRFAIPQFADAMGAGRYGHDWRAMPHEIPDAFVRRFAEWSAESGVKGKYSIVPFPACLGRLDRELPGWTRQEVEASIRLVREHVMPNWDIHPEMVTHTRIIDLKTGHPVEHRGRAWMENWDWCAGRSADEIAAYISYALTILKNIGLPCEGVTSPGGFGAGALTEYSAAAGQALRHVFQTDIPHYFRNLFDKGAESVAPRIEPGPVVSIYACTGDWTGNWDCSTQPDAARYISADLKSGRMVEVIERGEPAIALSHWTGIWYNGRELGFAAMREVARRLDSRFGRAIRWMKLAEIARYWAVKQLAGVSVDAAALVVDSPYACPDFTVRWPRQSPLPFREAASRTALEPGTWVRDGIRHVIACVSLQKGQNRIG
jgi:hypothetical protein